MNNGDTPAMAQSGVSNIECDSYDFGGRGLTKREHFAAIAMQGLLVNMGRNEFNDCVVVADEAVNAADALLKALEAKA